MDDIDLLKDLLQNYSPSHQEEAAVQTLVAWMNAHDYTAFVDGVGNAVGSRGNGPHEIMLLGHIDTVPGFIEVRQEGDVLYGRGAVDAKGPLACFAAAGASVAPPPGWRITVVGAVGEESQSHGALYLRDRYQPEFLVIGEPSKWERITLGFKGSLWVKYHLRQALAHSASRQEAACETAVNFWNALQKWCSECSPADALAFYQLSATLRSMNSESDGFYENARLEINLRLPPGITPGLVVNKLQELKGAAKIEVTGGIEAFRSEKNTPLVRAFLSAIRQFGGAPSFSLKTGTSDMNLVAPVWGCPAVAYGPGDSNLDHTPDEHIHLSEYLKSIQVLAVVLRLTTAE